MPTPQCSFHLNDMLHVPYISYNLLSVHKLTKDNNCSVTFDANFFVIQDKISNQVLHKGSNHHGLYQFASSSSSPHPQACIAPSPSQVSMSTWHQRLGHSSFLKMQHIVKHLPVVVKNNSAEFSCTPCNVAKVHRLPFKLSTTTINRPFSLVHNDVWGPFHASTSGFKYYRLFVDDFTRFTWIYTLHVKSEVFSTFLSFKAYVETQFATPLQILRIDNGTKFVTKQMDAYLTQHGVIHQLSCPYTPEQNGIAERKHQHITETAIALLSQSSMPVSFWFEAISTAVFLINRLLSLSFGHKSPFELLFHNVPDYSFLKVFGCQCFPWLRPYVSHKLQPQSTPCVFIGYHPTSKGYRCLDPLTGKIHLSRHVLFIESCFPFAYFSNSQPSSLSDLSSFFWTVFASSKPISPDPHLPPPSAAPIPFSIHNSGHHTSTSLPTSSSLEPALSTPTVSIPVNSISIDLPLVPPSISPPSVQNVHPMVTRSKAAHFSWTGSQPLLTDLSLTEPLTTAEALKSPIWVQAMNEKFQALHTQDTWDLVALPSSKSSIGCKWIFRF